MKTLVAVENPSVFREDSSGYEFAPCALVPHTHKQTKQGICSAGFPVNPSSPIFFACPLHLLST